jgi:hypothetical protein
VLIIAQAERIAQKYLAAQEGSHTLLAQDPKSLTLPPCKLDIPMPICTSEMREVLGHAEAAAAGSVARPDDQDAVPASGAHPLTLEPVEKGEAGGQQPPPPASGNDSKVSPTAAVGSGQSQQTTPKPAKVECPGFVVLSNYEKMLNGTLEDTPKSTSNHSVSAALSDTSNTGNTSSTSSGHGAGALDHTELNGAGEQPSIVMEPSVAAGTENTKSTTAATGKSSKGGKHKTKRQRKEQRFQPGRPWKQPARYIKYVPPIYQRTEWWEPVPPPGASSSSSASSNSTLNATGTLSTGGAAMVGGGEMPGGDAGVASCFPAQSTLRAAAEIDESEEWHFRCVCGVVAHWDDKVPKRLIGRQFECEGCAAWAHTDCYPRYRALTDEQLESGFGGDGSDGKERLLCFACSGKK